MLGLCVFGLGTGGRSQVLSLSVVQSVVDSHQVQGRCVHRPALFPRSHTPNPPFCFSRTPSVPSSQPRPAGPDADRTPTVEAKSGCDVVVVEHLDISGGVFTS